VEGLKKEVVRHVVEEEEEKRVRGGVECMGIMLGGEREREQKIRREKKEIKKFSKNKKTNLNSCQQKRKTGYMYPTLKQHVSTRDNTKQNNKQIYIYINK
tara:strand:- start:98 stop:397 length:300 start_codon:yes stop_codon:yes gene_type:complete